MTRLLSDLVAPGGVVPNTKATAFTIRRFEQNDHARVLEICRNVYGGTDYIPRLIHHFSARPGTTVLVSRAAAGPDSVNGIMCGHKRGAAYFLFGLRVAEDDRGKGLARALMEAICQRSEDFGPIQAITTATIPQQPAAIRLFNSMGFLHTHTIDVWPSYEALSQYEQLVDVHLTASAPDPAQLCHQPNMLDVLGFQGLLAEQNSANVQLQDWVQCSSEYQLQEAVASIRKQQLKQAESHQVAPNLPVEQLPWAYETFPLDAPWMLESLAQGRVWLLPCSRLREPEGSSNKPTDNDSSGSLSAVSSTGGSGSCSTSSLSSLSISDEAGVGSIGPSSTKLAICVDHCPQQYAALVVTDFSIEMRRYCAGAMTADDTYIAGAIQLVASQLPHFLCFCDRGSRHSSGKPDPHVVLPTVITETGRASCFTAYARESEANSYS